jgi:hypothetical protein
MQRIPNRYPGACRHCAQQVAAGGGFAVNDGNGWLVEHGQDGTGCPSNSHNPDNAPTWVVSCGAGDGGQPYRPGQVLRESWWTSGGGPPADQVPGGQDVGDGQVSGVVTVVAATAHYYAEDGMSFGVGEDEGHLYVAHVRAATEPEAAAVLADEAVGVRRGELRQRLRTLLAWRYPTGNATYPAPGTLDEAAVLALPEIPIRSESATLSASLYPDRLLLDEPTDLLWTLVPNGADGDDWSQSNVGRCIALSHPLTDARRRLVEDLRAEFASVEAWTQAGYSAEAAEHLIGAGWTLPRLREEMGAVAARTLPDAQAFTARSPQQWKAAGWSWRAANASFGNVPAAEAAQLADAGITAERAAALHHAGLTTTAAKLAATPPQLPTTPGRFVLPGPPGWGAWVTDDPAQAQEAIARQPAAWAGWRHDEGLTCVHVSTDWQLWSDDSISRGHWLPEHHPTGLPEEAATLIGLIASASNTADVPRQVRRRLRDTVSCTTTVERTDHRERTSSGSTVQLTRHDATLADHSTLTLWRVVANESGLCDGEGYDEEWARVYLDAAAATAQFREEQAALSRG